MCVYLRLCLFVCVRVCIFVCVRVRLYVHTVACCWMWVMSHLQEFRHKVTQSRNKGLDFLRQTESLPRYVFSKKQCWQAGCSLHQCVHRNTLAGLFRWFLWAGTTLYSSNNIPCLQIDCVPANFHKARYRNGAHWSFWTKKISRVAATSPYVFNEFWFQVWNGPETFSGWQSKRVDVHAWYVISYTLIMMHTSTRCVKHTRTVTQIHILLAT